VAGVAPRPALLVVLFIVGGAVALAVQTVWARALSQIFGATHESLGVLLALQPAHRWQGGSPTPTPSVPLPTRVTCCWSAPPGKARRAPRRSCADWLRAGGR
jgi:hypothetical protein